MNNIDNVASLDRQVLSLCQTLRARPKDIEMSEIRSRLNILADGYLRLFDDAATAAIKELGSLGASVNITSTSPAAKEVGVGLSLNSSILQFGLIERVPRVIRMELQHVNDASFFHAPKVHSLRLLSLHGTFSLSICEQVSNKFPNLEWLVLKTSDGGAEALIELGALRCLTRLDLAIPNLNKEPLQTLVELIPKCTINVWPSETTLDEQQSKTQ
jgi:hypothetical protein